MDDYLESVGFWGLALFSDRNNLSEAFLFLEKQTLTRRKYSVDSIKRTVLLKVLLLKKTSKNLY